MAANIKRLREQRRPKLTLDELSRRMEELGRPIIKSGLSKIETGERRVDVDDLVALAVALGVTPNALLLDPEVDEARIALTPARETTRRIAWCWAAGEASYPASAKGDVPTRWYMDLPVDEVTRAVRPHHPPLRVKYSELKANQHLIDEATKHQEQIRDAGAPDWVMELLYGGQTLLVTDEAGGFLE